jgi:peptidoglycan hydrolase-like protein with peptidoglycan-binding domain
MPMDGSMPAVSSLQPEFRVRRFASVLLVLSLTAAWIVAEPAEARAGSYEYGQMVEYPLVFPVAGPVSYTDSFWASRYNGTHHAQDLMADKMTPVVAAATGTIDYVNWSSNPNDLRPGNCCSLRIIHDDGWETTYIHLNNDTPGTDDGQGWGIAPGIVPGVRVEAGQLIGWVGDSGNAESTPPHLHFELDSPDGTAVNPYQALRAAENGTAPPTVSAPACTAESVFANLMSDTRVLRQGSTGGDVADLQSFLTVAGFDSGPADGVFGPRTKGAVVAFQLSRGISGDGAVGSQTRAAISALGGDGGLVGLLDPGASVLRPGEARGEMVKLLQEWLLIAGYDPGEPDGVYGDLTADAVSEFQIAADLTVDGKVGPNTRRALGAALGLDDLPTCG